MTQGRCAHVDLTPLEAEAAAALLAASLGKAGEWEGFERKRGAGPAAAAARRAQAKIDAAWRRS